MDRITDPTELVKAATRRRPTGPGFSIKDAQRSTVLVIEATQVTDPGPDFTRWTLLNDNGTQIATADVPGY
jgi:hypothetical protein